MVNVGEFIVNHWLLVALLLILSWLVFSNTFHQKMNGFSQISTSQAIHIVNKGKGSFVDIREVVEFNKEHISNSINIPVSKLAENIAKLNNPADPIILIHGGSQQAHVAVKQLQKNNFTDIYVLKGGLNAWRDAKLPLF